MSVYRAASFLSSCAIACAHLSRSALDCHRSKSSTAWTKVMSGRAFETGGMGAASGCLRRRIASSRMSSTTSRGISCASTTIGSSAVASAARRRENQAESSDRNSASATGASTTRAPGSSPACITSSHMPAMPVFLYTSRTAFLLSAGLKGKHAPREHVVDGDAQRIAFAPGARETPMTTAGAPLIRRTTSSFWPPIATLATSRTRNTDPSGLARSTIAPNCSGVVRRPASGRSSGTADLRESGVRQCGQPAPGHSEL